MGEKAAGILSYMGAGSKLGAVVPASRLDVRPLPEMVSSGIAQLDSLCGGFPRGCLTEICGTGSSGRTSILLSALAHVTEQGEVCALVDASDAFDPASAAAAGMEMNRLLWVRCGEKKSLQKDKSHKDRNKDKDFALTQKISHEKTGAHPNMPGMPARDFDLSTSWGIGQGQATEKKFGFRRWESRLSQLLKVTDLLLQSNGFGMIALDLGDIPVQSARRISLASWFRFRRAVENTPTVLLVLEQQPIAGSCSSLLVKVSGNRSQDAGKKRSTVSSQLSVIPPMLTDLAHAQLLDQLEITAELLCSRFERKLERKPVQSTRASFKSRAAWAG